MKKSASALQNGNADPSNLLRVLDLRVHFSRGFFRKQTVRAVDGVSFAITRGETFGLVGESGCGKSTLARCLLRLVEPTSGKVFFDGMDLFSQAGNSKGLRKRIQIIFQDADGALNPRFRALDLVLEPLKVHGLTRGEAREKALELLRRVNLPPDVAGRHPYELSGGQRQRIGIARAVSLAPELLVADEAAASLDILMQAQIVKLLKQLQSEMGMSYLFISHNLSLIKRIADRLAVMYLGKFVETGYVRDVFADPAHPYTRALLSCLPGELPLSENTPAPLRGEMPSPIQAPSGCAFATRCPEARDICSVLAPSLCRIDDNHTVACHLASC
jgi:oligopeptide/dipeptide ABC transporter ATP-binding protein